jgi:uncharacterized protein (TIGR00730 family)
LTSYGFLHPRLFIAFILCISILSYQQKGVEEMDKFHRGDLFPSAHDDAKAAQMCPMSPQTLSASYRLAYTDYDFIMRDELRPVRLQLELMKPELVLNEHRIKGTVVIFGGSRIPEPAAAKERLEEARRMASIRPGDKGLEAMILEAERLVQRSRYYEEARRLSFLISKTNKESSCFNLVVVTGGGPGIMEAANRGASEADCISIALNIVLPHEQKPNPYITPELCFQFHYFAIRKMHFLMRAKALVVFPGGYGTLDELFEVLTLVQTRKIRPLPVLIFGRSFWNRVINFEALVEEGSVSPGDIQIFQYVETAEEAFEIISERCAAG